MSVPAPAPASPPANPAAALHRRRWWVLAVLCLSALLMVVANMALNVALPALGRDLGASSSALAWIVDAYVLCFAGLLLPAGALGDRYGRKAVLQAGLVVFTLAALAGALCQHPWQLITARAVMGAGAAMVTPGTLSILAHVFAPPERAKAIGIWAAVAGGSVAISLTWSGLMLEHFWWGSLFLGMAAVAVLALVAGQLVLPENRADTPAPLDPVGAVLSVLGVTGLLYGFIQAPDLGWTSAAVLGAFGVGVLGMAAFTLVELRRAHPMLELRHFRVRGFSVGSLAIAAAYFALFGMYFLLTQYLQLVRGFTPLQAGLAALPAGVAQLVVATWARPVVARFGMRAVLAGGLVAGAGGLLALATASGSSSLWPIELGLAAIGLGVGLTMPPATGAIMAALPPDQAGIGSAVNNLVRELGGAFGIGLLGSITLLRYRHGLPTDAGADAGAGLAQALAAPDAALHDAARIAFTAGMDLAMIAGAVVVALCALAAHRALAARRRPHPA